MQQKMVKDSDLLKSLLVAFGFGLQTFIRQNIFSVMSSQNKKDLDDVTAARFWCFFAAGSWEKYTKNGAAVTSLRFFLFCDDFSSLS